MLYTNKEKLFSSHQKENYKINKHMTQENC